jgi:ATP-binding cassette subfamily B protein
MKVWSLRFARYAQPYTGELGAIGVLTVMGVLLSVLMPWPVKLIVDYTLAGKTLPEWVAWIRLLPWGSSTTGILGWLVAGSVVLFLLQKVVSIAQGYFQAGVGTRMVYGLGADVFHHLQKLSLRIHNQQRSGDLVRRVTGDTACVRTLIMSIFLPLVTSALTLLMMSGVMWQLNHTLSLLAIVVAAPLPLIIKRTSTPMTDRSYEREELQGEIMALAEQTLTALPVVQAFNRESFQDDRFRALSKRGVEAYLQLLKTQLRFKIVVATPTAVGSAAMLVLGGFQVLQGTMSVGSLLVFLAYVESLYAPLSTIAYLSSDYAVAAASARRVLEILDLKDVIHDAPGARTLPILPTRQRGHLVLENITFGYEQSRPVLHDISIEARPGETVALVGSTGAGKSTVASLIPRLFDPWEGRVVIDGVDVRDVQLRSLRAQVALVLQEPFLLPLSIAQNIAYGRTDATRDDVIAAAVAANADDFIRRLPQGYDTVIGERGATLSGGERQRIAIARALLKNARILVLDEPTSALDTKTEASLLDAFERLMEGRTTFIIAHRLSTIRRADKIVVLHHGKVIESGNHVELLREDGMYTQFYKTQIGANAATAQNLV